MSRPACRMLENGHTRASPHQAALAKAAGDKLRHGRERNCDRLHTSTA
ncbi:hypothetical protein BURPS668_A0404 [Burkholderia pseudomallei 668]|nr:hypothetical protein BURPS668_A0404 [Burkholderia pseudomallei 668]